MTKREILKLNGYRPALGGWSCADCKWSYRGSTHIYCSHRQNVSASSGAPGVARDSVCDLFSPSRRTAVAHLRRPPRLPPLGAAPPHRLRRPPIQREDGRRMVDDWRETREDIT